MRYTIVTAAGMALAFTQPAWAAPPSPADRQSLERLAAANDSAWNAKDVETLGAQYVPEGTLRVGDNSMTDREQVKDFLGRAFARRQGTFRHITRLDQIDMIDADTAFSDALVAVEQQLPDGSWKKVREFRNWSISVRQDGEWKLRAVRAQPLPAPAQP